MIKGLYFHSPFKDSSLGDEYRQMHIDLQTEADNDLICFVLDSTFTDLENFHDPNTFDEIFSTILTCFSRFPEYSLPFLERYLDKLRLNENYIIITTLIIYNLTHNQAQINIPESIKIKQQSIYEDIINNIKISNNDQIIIFDHQIPSEFANSLILNLFLISKLTDTLISNLFPYILTRNLYLNNPKFNLVLQNLFKFNYLQISNLTDTENNELFELLKNDLKINTEINLKTLLFISSSVLFTRNGGITEIKGLTCETILPFLAITVIYHKKYNPKISFSNSKINGLLLNSINSLSKNKSSLILDVSVSVILENLEYLYENDFFSSKEILNMIVILLQKLIKNEYTYCENKLLSILFDFSGYNLAEPLKNFIVSNQTEIFNFIFNHLSNTNNIINKKINLNIFDKSLIVNHIQSLTNTSDDIFKLIHFIDNFCLNIPESIFSAELLLRIINDKIKEKSWNDVLFLNILMKKNGYKNDIQNDSIPKNIRKILFDEIPNENSDIDDILSYILSDSNPEENNVQRFKILFNKMIKDKDIFENYVSYLFYLNDIDDVSSYLPFFLDEYEKNSDDFLKIVNQFYYFNEKMNKFSKESYFKLESLPISELGLSLVSKLLDSVNDNPLNYQAFLCMKNIASSFPFLFNKDTQKIFNIILPCFEYFYLIFDNNLNEESINSVKTAYSAMFFIYSTFQSPIILDNFLDWLFCNIMKFSNSQVFCFIMILLNFKLSRKNDYIIAIFEKARKYNFFKICRNLLEREIKGNIFRNYYEKFICEFISIINTRVIKYLNRNDPFEIKKCCIELDEYAKIERGLCILENFHILKDKIPYFTSFHEIESEYLNKYIADFLFKLDTYKDIGLYSWIDKEKKRLPTELQINDFKSKIKKYENLIRSDQLLNFPYPLSIKMFRYLVKQQVFIYMAFTFDKRYAFFLTPANYKHYMDVIDKFHLLRIQGMNDKEDKENDDIDSFDVSSYLIPWFKEIIDVIICPSLEYNNFLALLEMFSKSKRSLLVCLIDSISQYLNELSTQDIGSESYLSTKSIYLLVDILSHISVLTNNDIEAFYQCIDNLLKLILLPKWRNDTDLLMKVSLFIACFNPLPERANHLIADQIYKLSPNKRKNYITVNQHISLIPKILKKFYLINHIGRYCKFASDNGFCNASLIYSYMKMRFSADKENAVKFFKKAIEFDSNNEMHQKALKLIDHDIKEAIYFFKNHRYVNKDEYWIINQSNDPKLIYDLAKSYEVGKDHPKNIFKAYMLYKIAADLGETTSMLKYSTYLRKLSLDDNIKDEDFKIKLKEEQYKYLITAAEDGNDEAKIIYIRLLLNDKDMPKPKDLSKWLSEGVIYNFSKAKYKYGRSFIKKNDMHAGNKFIMDAANDGCLDAISYLHIEYMKKHDIYNNNSFEYFETDAKKYMQILLDYKKDNSKIFVDENFPHFNNWKRIDELYKAPLFQSDLIDPSFVNQGTHGDCYLMVALSRIAKQYYLVPLLFETKLPNEILGHVKDSINIKCGAVIVYFQAFGRKVPVLIDTFVPVNKFNIPLLSRPSDKSKSPWFCLVEKAFIKLQGTFKNSYSGFFFSSIYSLFFYQLDFHAIKLSFEQIMEYQEKGCLICASINKMRDNSMNLISKHAYIILKARTCNKINFVFLQNPWGHTEWTGDYSKDSKLWTPGMKKALNYDYYPRGTFWMTYDDFSCHFNQFSIIKPTNPECHIKMFQYQLLPGDTDGINYKAKESKLEEHRTFVIHIKDEIPDDKSCIINIIVEYRQETFSYKNKQIKYILIAAEINGEKIKHDTVINNPKCKIFCGIRNIESFTYTVTKNEDISILIHRDEKMNFIGNCFVNIICEYQFDIYDIDNPTILYKEIDNPGIVFENYSLSNPTISKKIKMKLFNKKFIISLDSETSSNIETRNRDERIGNLFAYANMDFSSSYIDLNESYINTKKIIGRGTYGCIYIITDKNTDEQYAAKILKKSINDIPLQFLRELKILYSLRYPSIVRFIGFSDKSFDKNDHPTIVMEYLQNGSLYEFLNDKEKDLNNTKRMIILIGIALGIKYLHNHGIIHRDLKLQNVLLDNELNPKICDFGDSKPINLEMNKSFNVGTGLYMAPEMNNGMQYSFPVDVYSYGIIAYYIYSKLTPKISRSINLSNISNQKISNFVKELINEDPDKRPTLEQIVKLFLTNREKTWLDDVDEDEIDKYLHKFGLSIKPQNQNINLEFIRSINEDKYPINAKEPKMTIEEIINNKSIASNIINDIKSAEDYLNGKTKGNENIKQIRKLLFNIGYQFCMGDKEATRNIQEDYYYAIKYLKEAALLKDKTSLYLLAKIFSKETNDESQKIAFKFADISADLGFVDAFSLLGIFYKNGIGVQQNVVMSAIYFKIAADKGNASSMYQFANLLMQIRMGEIEFSEFNKQLNISKNIIEKINGKSNKIYREIQYTLDVIQDKNVALFVSEKYFEKASHYGIKNAEEIMKIIQSKVSKNNEPDFIDDLCKTISVSIESDDE